MTAVQNMPNDCPNSGAWLLWITQAICGIYFGCVLYFDGLSENSLHQPTIKNGTTYSWKKLNLDVGYNFYI
jgi:hypothetical protein